MGQSFTDLDAWQRARALANDIRREVRTWEPFEKWSIGIQLVRSADSVGANIAEAVGRWHTADRRHLLVVARGSLLETEHWLLLAADGELIAPEMQQRIGPIARPLNGLIRRASPR